MPTYRCFCLSFCINSVPIIVECMSPNTWSSNPLIWLIWKLIGKSKCDQTIIIFIMRSCSGKRRKQDIPHSLWMLVQHFCHWKFRPYSSKCLPINAKMSLVALNVASNSTIEYMIWARAKHSLKSSGISVGCRSSPNSIDKYEKKNRRVEARHTRIFTWNAHTTSNDHWSSILCARDKWIK